MNKWEHVEGQPLDRRCPHCGAAPRSPCRTRPGGHVRKTPHAKRHMARVTLSRYAVTRGGRGHVRDGQFGALALCGTAVILEAQPDITHVSCPGCRGVLAHLARHPGDPLNLRILPLSG